MTKTVYGNITMAEDSNIILNPKNAAEIVREGLYSLSTKELCEALCYHLIDMGMIDRETFNTLCKLCSNDYISIFLQILMNKEKLNNSK